MFLAFLLAAQVFTSDYPAQLVRVIDGDTVNVHVCPWTGLIVETWIRLLNIGTPELRGECDAAKVKVDPHDRSLTREVLIAGGLARSYEGGKWAGWCER